MDRFFGRRQHTVFFRCDAQALRDVWRKKDYPDFTPHLTIYDGPSRDMAERLLATIEPLHPSFSFAMSGIEPMVSLPGQQGGMSLVGVEAEDALKGIASVSLDPLRIDELSASVRLSAIERLCNYLISAAGGRS